LSCAGNAGILTRIADFLKISGCPKGRKDGLLGIDATAKLYDGIEPVAVLDSPVIISPAVA